MAVLNRGKTFTVNETVTNTKLHQLIDNGTVSDIDQADIAAAHGLTIRSGANPSDTDALWVDTSGVVDILKVYDGTSWTEVPTIPSSGLSTGDLMVWDGTNWTTGVDMTLQIASQAQGDILYYDSSDWVVLPAGTNGQFLKTQGAAADPIWADAPAVVGEGRYGLDCLRNSSTVIDVTAGEINVGGTIVTKTATTSLTLSVGADWASGISGQAVSTYGYVGIDASGNIKLDTTAPTHSDFALTLTNSPKAYASWSGTTYKVIGWFYMNATGSGELDTYGVSNVKVGDTSNTISSIGSTDISTGSGSATLMNADMELRFYCTGRPVKVNFAAPLRDASGSNAFSYIFVDDIQQVRTYHTGNVNNPHSLVFEDRLTEGVHKIDIRWSTSGGTIWQEGATSGNRVIVVSEK